MISNKKDMIKKEFSVPVYDFKIIFIEIESKDDAEKARFVFRRFKMKSENINEELDNITNGFINGGNTYRNMERKLLLVIIYQTTSEKTRRNVVNHEKRHVEDRILEYCQINDFEAASYLAGFLSEKIY
jgi:hypothetical protein